jgi:hypothetical protein
MYLGANFGGRFEKWGVCQLANKCMAADRPNMGQSIFLTILNLKSDRLLHTELQNHTTSTPYTGG